MQRTRSRSLSRRRRLPWLHVHVSWEASPHRLKLPAIASHSIKDRARRDNVPPPTASTCGAPDPTAVSAALDSGSCCSRCFSRGLRNTIGRRRRVSPQARSSSRSLQDAYASARHWAESSFAYTCRPAGRCRSRTQRRQTLVTDHQAADRQPNGQARLAKAEGTLTARCEWSAQRKL